MKELIKAKLQELLLACINNGYQFNFTGNVNALSVYKFTEGKISYVEKLYYITDWNGSYENHITALNEIIDKVEGHE